MLSYRHGFHAGNHADVLKHAVYLCVLSYLGKKDKPFSIIDTHSGAGAYSLSGDFASKNKEYLTGIGKLWQTQQDDMPESIVSYVEAVKRFNKEHQHDELTLYPGSPWFALDKLPLQGKAFFHELHNTDSELLTEFVRCNRFRKVIHGDGFVNSVGLFPPPSKRGVAIIDPSYEIKDDYKKVVDYVAAMYKRFNSGVYMIWYPVVERHYIDDIEQRLKQSSIKNVQLFELSISADSDQKGMTGSGMIVINPPWTLKQQMEQALPYLEQQLAGEGGFSRCIQLIDE